MEQRIPTLFLGFDLSLTPEHRPLAPTYFWKGRNRKQGSRGLGGNLGGARTVQLAVPRGVGGCSVALKETPPCSPFPTTLRWPSLEPQWLLVLKPTETQ